MALRGGILNKTVSSIINPGLLRSRRSFGANSADQLGAKNFSGGALRQARGEFYVVRNLVRCDSGPQAIADGIGEISSSRVAPGQDHHRVDLIAYIAIGD